MDMKQPLSLFLVAILVASVFTVVGIASIPLQKASAQAVTIETSADALGGTFFGHGALQVVIEDDDADDDNADTIDVTIEADGDVTDTDTFTIPDTTAGSQRFEFFLVHVASDIDASVLDGINPTPFLITFGNATADLDTGDDLYEDISFEIRYRNEEVTVDYEEVAADLTFDRDVFGSTSLMRIFINDQDANINPTERDEFDITAADLNGELFVIDGGVFVIDPLTFEETGDNTGVFEAEVSLDGDFDATEETIQVTLNDQAEYNSALSNAIPINDPTINDSTDTSEFTIEIEDADGEIDDVNDPTFGSELVVTVRDNDQNIDSENDDTLADALTIEVDNAGGDSETVDLEETGDNTGVFEFDLSNGELRITFLANTQSPTPNNGILELRSEDIEEDLIVSYLDPLDDDSTPNTVAEFTIAMSLTPGSLSAPETVGINDEFTVTLNDRDLNDNKRTRDSYTIVLDGEGPYPLMRGGLSFSEIYTFDLELDGDAIDFTTPVSVSIRETGIDTGIFEFDIDMQDIIENADVDISDGDDLEISIDDFMADTGDADEDDVTITIGKADVGVDFSRTTVPIPPEDGSLTAAGVGDEVIVTMIVNDPQRANQSNVQETFDFVFGTGPGQFTLEIEGDDVEEQTIDTDAEFAAAEIIPGVLLSAVMTIDDLEETGKATGVFEAEIAFSMDGVPGMDSQDWQDAEFTFTYNDGDDEESGGFTFRGNDAVLSVDQPSAKSGTVVTITVEDEDLNVDDNEIDTFDSGDLLGAAGIQALLLIEAEDDDIDQDISEQFEETGEDTGIFTASFIVGDDIQITELDVDELVQSTNILITYEDEIDSTGGSGDDIEINIPIASSTGSIQVSPDIVGPATEITVLIVDTDLDEDARSVDEYIVPAGQEDTDDFFVSFKSDRREVGEASPDIEETGQNTGVFMFTIELITDADDCADDDLSDDKFEATGGDTEASIGACPGDLIAIRYEDEKSGSGGKTTVSEVVEVMSFDPEFAVSDDTINPGDRVTVTISDPDANRKSDIADSLRGIRVTSDSDRVGEEYSAIETGRDTGVFRLSFGTTTGTTSGSISVKTGDDITVRYTDEFPADFGEEEDDKDFFFVIAVGAGGGQVGSTTVTPPAATDVTGRPIDEVTRGQQIVLTTTVVNAQTVEQPFVALVEVRDDIGVTVYLAWQTGTLNPSGRANVGLSWTPEISGDYTVRTFVISSLNNPQILSIVSESEITVS